MSEGKKYMDIAAIVLKGSFRTYSICLFSKKKFRGDVDIGIDFRLSRRRRDLPDRLACVEPVGGLVPV